MGLARADFLLINAGAVEGVVDHTPNDGFVDAALKFPSVLPTAYAMYMYNDPVNKIFGNGYISAELNANSSNPRSVSFIVSRLQGILSSSLGYFLLIYNAYGYGDTNKILLLKTSVDLLVGDLTFPNALFTRSLTNQGNIYKQELKLEVITNDSNNIIRVYDSVDLLFETIDGSSPLGVGRWGFGGSQMVDVTPATDVFTDNVEIFRET